MNEIHDELELPSAFFDYNLDPNIIRKCLDEMKDPIEDKNKFYTTACLQRLEECNAQAVQKFDDALSKILEIDLSQSLSKNDFREIHKIMKYTNKITTKMQRSLVELLVKLQSN